MKNTEYMNNSTNLSFNEKKVLNRFVDDVIQSYKGTLESIKLFGSSAFTKNHKDIDLAILVNYLPEQEPISKENRFEIKSGPYGTEIKIFNKMELFEEKIKISEIPLHYLVFNPKPITKETETDSKIACAGKIILETILNSSISLYEK
ncbi:MAG: hypothetical protein PHN56_02255 [Candidatus Nanoarchaeia archaeon]|nr:hypothetical protein [Candidatus Nanoarchaeia archaeon]